MKTAIVTGAAGFIGSQLSAELLRSGWRVHGVDCFTDYYEESVKRSNIGQVSANQDFVLHESRIEDCVDDILLGEGVSTIFHLAGQAGVRGSWGKDFESYIGNNIRATQKLLESVMGCPSRPKVIYSSSSSVYGNASTYPTTENTLTQPRSPYGVSKLAGENLVSLYADVHGLDAVSLRYFTVFGPGQRPDMAFTRLILSALLDIPFPMLGDGSQVRDFTFVGDVVAANLAAAEVDVPRGAIYNVAGGASSSLADAIDLIESITASKITLDRKDVAAGDVVRTGGSTNRIRADLGWTPVVDLHEGLKRQVEDIRGRLALFSQILDGSVSTR